MDKQSQELIAGYLTKAESKLAVAEKLFQGKDFEDAVSRAYYAAFHAAQAILLTEGLQADSHAGVRTLFGLHFAKTGKIPAKMGRYLSNLKDDREEGDYDVYSSIDQETAQNAVREANEFVTQARLYLKSYLP